MGKAFTLIEMLVVIGVIGILALMVVGLAPLASRKKIDARVNGEMQQLVTAIEAYKAKKGFYPPSNPTDESKPPLLFELSGARKTATGYETLDGMASISDGQMVSAYGVQGFVNSTTMAKNDAGDPDQPNAESFHTGLKTSQTTNMVYLGVAYKGPDGDFSRWRYHTGPGPAPISGKARQNKEGYDLWIELTVGGKTKAYGNWKE